MVQHGEVSGLGHGFADGLHQDFGSGVGSLVSAPDVSIVVIVSKVTSEAFCLVNGVLERIDDVSDVSLPVGCRVSHLGVRWRAGGFAETGWGGTEGGVVNGVRSFVDRLVVGDHHVGLGNPAPGVMGAIEVVGV